jgi:hypothetical protein
MKKRLEIFKNKRAITPVLSNLLLTVIAVAAMAIATTATYVITTNMRATMSERLAVEDVWFNNATHNIDVYLRNTGQVAISVQAVYVNHTSQGFVGQYRFGIGEHAWLNISKNWAPNEVYYIDVTTSRGTHVAAYYAT